MDFYSIGGAERSVGLILHRENDTLASTHCLTHNPVGLRPASKNEMDVLQVSTSKATWRSQTNPRRRLVIGPLEAEAMELLWKLGEGSVRDVLHQLPQPAAYTTVMTTLARLFMKGVLTRRKVERKFLYRPRFTAEEWHKRAAMEAAFSFLSTPDTSHDLLMSCLQEALALQGTTELPSTYPMKGRDKRYLGVKRRDRHSSRVA